MLSDQGVYGVKPTVGRLPISGWLSAMAGSEHILGTIGPLCTSLEGCKLFIKSIIAGQPWLREPSLLPLPWKEEDAYKGRKLKVAVLWDDGVVKPHPPVTRAMKKVVEELKAKGHEVVDWTPYKHDEAWAIIVSPVPNLSDSQADSARQTSISAMALPRTWPS